jgi:hypothetical protein
MDKTAKIGFHSTSVEAHGKRVESKDGNQVLVAYYQSLGIGIMASVALIAASPDNVSWYTPKNFADIGKPVEVLPSENPTPAPMKVLPSPAENTCGRTYNLAFSQMPLEQCHPFSKEQEVSNPVPNKPATKCIYEKNNRCQQFEILND